MIKDIVEENAEKDVNADKIAKIKEIIPNCFDKNGRLDTELLKEEFKDDLDYTKESYELNFLGKSYAKMIAGLDTETVIEPDTEHNEKEENKNSENIYISGDNLDALKHLVKAKGYEGHIKCIYIDPPYNTGSDDFIYNDNFKFDKVSLMDKLDIDENEAERILNMTSGKSSTHSAWLTFMYPRLYLSRQLLSDDGVIFISIDDNEQADLKLLCDSIFGEESFVTTIHCQMSTTQGMKVKAAQEGNIVKNAEYILCYTKDGHKNVATEQVLYDLRPEYDTHYNLYINDDGTIVPLEQVYNYKFPKDCSNDKPLNLKDAYKISNEFRNFVVSHKANIVCTHNANIDSTDEFGNDIKPKLKSGDYIKFKKKDKEYLLTLNSKGKIRQLLRLEDSWGKTDGYYGETGLRKIRGNWWEGFYIDMGNVSKEGGVKYNDGKKPMRLIQQLAKMCTKENDIILDFFSGSATTAQAVMQLNANDKGNRKFILVQLPENLDEKLKNSATEDVKKTIKESIELCDEVGKPHQLDVIGQERVKNAAKQIKEETGADIDYGFKHYTLKDTSEDLLHKMEEFNPDLLINENTDLYKEYGIETILETWKLKDGYKFTDNVEKVDLDGYTAYRCGDCIYFIEPHIGIDNINALLQKYSSEEDFTCNKVVVFGYSFMFNELEMIKNNIKQVKNTTNIDVRAYTRY